MKSVSLSGQYSLQRIGKLLKICQPTRHQLKDLVYENVAIREPYAILQQWIEIGEKSLGRSKARHACLATVDSTGQPVMRLINVEQISSSGITFYTALAGRQAGNISCNPHVSLLFQWPHLERSVNVSGMVNPLCALQAQRRFNRYPHAIKLGLHGIHMPRRVANKWFFIGTGFERLGDLIAKFFGKQLQTVPMPYNWGGYLLVPHLYEFINAENDNSNRQCMRFRRCHTLPRVSLQVVADFIKVYLNFVSNLMQGKRRETVDAGCYDWVFDRSIILAN